MELYPFQADALKRCKGRNKVAFYYDMGLGKTFVGAEKMRQLGKQLNLVVCQKSKVQDWIDHFQKYYEEVKIFDLTKRNSVAEFLFFGRLKKYRFSVGVINYDLVFRRPELLTLQNFTLMLDESSMIQNEKAKRSKFILKMKPDNVILLSGTPTGGKYERLWSQLHLLGWGISKKLYWSQFVKVRYLDTMGGISIPIVEGYKNVERLKRKMREYGCHFLKTDEVLDLPAQTFQRISVPASKEYRTFHKSSLVTVDGVELVGDTTLTKLLYERQICGQYNQAKLDAFRDLVESTEDRLLVFYNFTSELERMKQTCNQLRRSVSFSFVNGEIKDLTAYNCYQDSITFVQYQAGAMGLNLQLANKIVYFSPPLSSELFEQSKKRIHRIGQARPCFYYLMICKGSVEEKIYKALEQRKDYTEELFRKE